MEDRLRDQRDEEKCGSFGWRLQSPHFDRLVTSWHDSLGHRDSKAGSGPHVGFFCPNIETSVYRGRVVRALQTPKMLLHVQVRIDGKMSGQYEGESWICTPLERLEHNDQGC